MQKISPERRPKGTRHAPPLVGAILLSATAGALSWPVLQPALAWLLAAIALALPAGLLWRGWWFRTPFDLPVRLPRRLSGPARIGWSERLFLGWTEGWLGYPRFALAQVEDSVGIVGPPRVNKTLGITVIQLSMWGGPALSVSPKPDLFRLTAVRRRQLADQYGGQVMIYAPTSTGLVEGLRPVRFSPASSQDPEEIKLRIDSWTEAAATGKNIENPDHWKSGAARILRGSILAAAHDRDRPGDFSLVTEWLAARDLRTPILKLQQLNTTAARQWEAELVGVQNMRAERERDGFFSAAETTVQACTSPTVLASTTGQDFDPEQFLLSRSTLFILAPTQHQRAVAPLISMLIETLVRTAYKLHHEGRLEARFLLSLDDMANCAPLPSIESTISQGGGQGVSTSWNLQSLAQNEVNYGAAAARAIWNATRAKLAFGGLDPDAGGETISAAIGEERVVTPGQSDTGQGVRASRHVTWRRILAASQLRELPSRWAVLIYLNERVHVLREPLAIKRHQVRRHLVPWTASQAGVEQQPASETPPVLTVVEDEDDAAEEVR